MEDFTRLRGEDEPSMLDLVFTKKTELQPIIKYLCPVGKSDRVLIEVELQEGTLARRGDNYKSGRLNYARANFEGLREFFERTDWRGIRREEEIAFEKDVVEKCENEPKLFYKYINGKMKY